MQGESTPFKESVRKNEAVVDFTSGKQKRKVYVTVVSAHRKDEVISSYRPLINIMARQQSSSSLQQQIISKGDDALKEEFQKVNESCDLKQQWLQQFKHSSPAAYQRLSQLIAHLREVKLLKQQRRQQLMSLKKANLKEDFKLQQMKANTGEQVEKMRMMVCKQDQRIYKLNEQIYNKEKERDALAAETAEIDATYTQTREEIRVSQIKFEQLKVEEKQEEEKLERLRTSQEEVRVKVKEGILHTTVLKMQVNPHLRVSFESLTGSLSTRKRILEKNPNLWQRKNKLLKPEEVKYFLLIQLYPGWRKLLDRLSFRFTGYRELFFQEPGESHILEDLDAYIFSNPKIIKYKSSIVIYSQRSEPYEEIREILMRLVGLRNCFIEILEVVFEKTGSEGVEKASISYTFKGEYRVKSYEVVQLRELTREALQAYMPSNAKPDRTSLIKIEIPSYFESPAERIRLEEVYRMVDRGA